MADPRLRYQQTAAPSFAGVSEAMGRANQSFNRGMESASGVIEKYQAGLEEQADNALLGEMAGLKDEAEFDAWVDGGALQNFGGSSGLRDQIMSMRSTFINDDGTRARTDGTRARTGIATARESRTAAEWKDQMARQDYMRNAAGNILSATDQAREIGLSADGMIQETVTGGGAPQQENQWGDAIARRVRVNFNGIEQEYSLPSGYLERTAQIESSGDPSAQNENSSAGGLFQQIDSNAREFGVTNRFDALQSTVGAAKFARQNAAKLRGVLGREPTGAELYLAHQQGGGGAASLLRDRNRPVRELLSADAIRLNGGNLNMTAGQFADLWINKWNGSRGGQSTSSGRTVTERPTELRQVRDEMAASGLFTAAQIEQALSGATTAGQAVNDERNAELDRQEGEDRNNAALDSIRDLIENPNVTSMAQIQSAVLSDPNLTEQEKITRMERIQALTGEGGAYEDRFNPEVGLTDAQMIDRDTTELLTQSIDRLERADPQLTAIRQSREWAEDPTESLLGELDLANDPQEWYGGLDKNDLRRMIRETARRNDISESEAAAAMSQAFVRDPGQAIPGWDLTANTLSNRFPAETVDSFAEEFFKEGNAALGNQRGQAFERTKRQAATYNSQIQQLNIQLEKARRNKDQALADSIQNQIVIAREALNSLRAN